MMFREVIRSGRPVSCAGIPLAALTVAPVPAFRARLEFPALPLDEEMGRRSLKEEQAMKTKAKGGRQTWISCNLIIPGLLIPLILFPLTARGAATTNFPASGFLPSAAAIMPELTLAASRDLMLNTNDNQVGIGGTSAGGSMLRQGIVIPTDATTNLPSSISPSGAGALNTGEAGFVAARAQPNPISILKRESAMPDLGARVLILQVPGSKEIHREGALANARLGWGEVGKLVVRFCEPSFHPSPPGGSHDLIQSESDRPWPVISAGAATGKCWNDPATYQAQGFLSLHW